MILDSHVFSNDTELLASYDDMSTWATLTCKTISYDETGGGTGFELYDRYGMAADALVPNVIKSTGERLRAFCVSTRSESGIIVASDDGDPSYNRPHIPLAHSYQITCYANNRLYKFIAHRGAYTHNNGDVPELYHCFKDDAVFKIKFEPINTL